MLFLQQSNQTQFFVNGETICFNGKNAELLKNLADKRTLAPQKIDDVVLLKQLLDWYSLGYLSFDR